MIRTALQNPYLVIVGALMIVVLGLNTYQLIPTDLLPQFNTPAVQIVTFYPGMPTEVMEKDIMSRLQRWTGQSVGIEHQEAKAMQGVCIVKDFFREDISMDTAMAQVTSYAMSDMFYLPPGTIPPMVMPFDPTASVPLCLVVVSNEQMDEQELYGIAYYELRNKLQSIQGVIAPAVYGGKLRRILAYVKREKLEAYGLTLMDVQKALLKQNVLIPAGSIKIGKQDLQILTNAIPEKIDELNDIPSKVVDGQPVMMRDVGEVQNASQIQTNIVRINGSRQAYIPIYRQPGANTVKIVSEIRSQLSTILLRLQTEKSDDPKMETLVLDVAMDQSIGVRQSITGLQIAGLLGAGLAGVVVLVFLRNITSTLLIVMAIPLAILASIFGLYLSGDTINSMTLGGLALAIGILVDQSIVVLENIIRHVQMGKKPREAAFDGAQEVAIPILVSTITFAIVFFPVVFLSGLAKFLFTPLALAATIAIFASYFISITLVPAYCASFLGTQRTQHSEAGAFTKMYGGFLSVLISARFIVVGGAIAAFVFTMILTMQLGQELFPTVDSGQVNITVRLPSGTNIQHTQNMIEQIEKSIMDEIGKPDPRFANNDEQHPESNLQLLISNIGVLMDWPAAYTPNSGPMDAFVLVQLKDKPGVPSIFEYVETLREKLNREFGENQPPDSRVEFAFDTGGMLTAALNMGEPSPVHFQIQSSDLEKAQSIAREIVAAAKSVAGTADVRIAQRIDYPILEVNMDRELAARQGITPEDVMKNLVSATNSSINFDPAFWIDKKGGNHYFFGVQYYEEDLNSIEALLTVPVAGEWDTPRRLGNVATITKTAGPAVVNHTNISRVTDVYANVLPDFDVGSVVTSIEAKLLADPNMDIAKETDSRGELYRFQGEERKGISFRMMGEVKSMRESFTQFSNGLLIASALVYLVMVAQFRSFVDPLVVMLSVPLGFIGVVGILLLTGTNLSIMAFMGIIMMVGIVVEYSNVLIDFANHRMADGLTAREAIMDAAKVRMRPILMTSLTTWLALVPMAIGAFGGEANAPLARAIIGGVIGATFLSLIVVPCLYVIAKDLVAIVNGMFGWSREVEIIEAQQQ
jgi:multidrug efflux pump subunit AcrB